MRLSDVIALQGRDVEAKAPGLVTKTYRISAPPEVLARFEDFINYVQWCAGVGHSTDVVMGIDGDGADSFYVESPKLPKVDEDGVSSSTVHVERYTSNV